MKWYLDIFKNNYANFSGRARRQEYWLFFLVNISVFIGFSFLSEFLNDIFDVKFFNYLSVIFLLVIVIPHFAVTTRRLHDIGKSGGYYFVAFIPVIGRLWLLILLCTEGDTGSNRYGLDPKQIEYDEIDEIGKIQLD